jgi:hypothetical protein
MGYFTHGLSGKNRSQYMAWYHMVERCHNPKSSRYSQYGGRGISVCDRWRNSVENFFEDMGDKPDGMTLDRINVDGDYCPENCKWSTWEEQQNNKQDSVKLSSGERAQDFCARIGLRYGNFRQMRYLNKMTPDEVAAYYLKKARVSL